MHVTPKKHPFNDLELACNIILFIPTSHLYILSTAPILTPYPRLLSILSRLRLLHQLTPSIRILGLPPLDILQRREKFREDWSWLLGLLSDVGECVVTGAAGDGADGDEGCGGAGGDDLGEVWEFFVFDLMGVS